MRLGVPQDFADGWLPRTLALFTLAYPNVRLEIVVEQSHRMLQLLRAGGLDIVLAFGEDAGLGSQLVATLPVHWFAHGAWRSPERDPLPLLLLEQSCVFRQRAIEALERAGLSWRVALSGGSVSAIWAAANAGLGLVARASIHVPHGVACLDGAFGLPEMNAVPLHLVRSAAGGDSAVEHLADLLMNMIDSHLEGDSLGVLEQRQALAS